MLYFPIWCHNSDGKIRHQNMYKRGRKFKGRTTFGWIYLPPGRNYAKVGSGWARWELGEAPLLASLFHRVPPPTPTQLTHTQPWHNSSLVVGISIQGVFPLTFPLLFHIIWCLIFLPKYWHQIGKDNIFSQTWRSIVSVDIAKASLYILLFLFCYVD